MLPKRRAILRPSRSISKSSSVRADIFVFGHTELTGRIAEIVRVDDRVVHGIRGVDVDATVAVWMLQCGRDADVAVAIAVHEENLDLAGRTVEDGLCGRVVDRLVAGHDSVVVGRVRGILVNSLEDLGLDLCSLAAVDIAGVGIGECGVDVSQEERVVLHTLDLCPSQPGALTNLFAAVVVENGACGFHIDIPFDGSTLLLLAVLVFPRARNSPNDLADVDQPQEVPRQASPRHPKARPWGQYRYEVAQQGYRQSPLPRLLLC